MSKGSVNISVRRQFVVILLGGIVLFSPGRATAQALDISMDGCARRPANAQVVCLFSMTNNGPSTVTRSINSSSSRRTGGLDKFVSWAWDNAGRKIAITGINVGSNSLRRWQLRVTIPSGLRVGGELILDDVPSAATSFQRIVLKLSPRRPVWKNIETYQFSNIPIH